MTSRLNSQTQPAGTGEMFPDFPPSDDMQNTLHLHKPSHIAALTAHFGNLDSTLVFSEIPVNWRVSQQRDQRIPDLLIAFNVNADVAIAQNGYAIVDQGKPPDFVLEVASTTTGRNDYTAKRIDYQEFGIPEYWRFDPTGGRRHDAPLAGDVLIDGVYRPVEIIQTDETHLWGHSQVLRMEHSVGGTRRRDDTCRPTRKPWKPASPPKPEPTLPKPASGNWRRNWNGVGTCKEHPGSESGPALERGWRGPPVPRKIESLLFH